MPLFEVPTRAGRESDTAIAKKSKSKAKAPTAKSSGGLLARIEQIRINVEQKLGQYKESSQIINTEEGLIAFIDKCIANRYCSVDTETTGLNPMQDHLVGICMYTRGEKTTYIPVNHISPITLERVPNQLPIDFVIKEFTRLFSTPIDVDMFNATFDIRVLRHFGIKNAYCTWDGSIGSRMMNENLPEGQRGLKSLHNRYCLDGKGDAFSFDNLFKGITFDKIPIEVGYLYASHDGIVTTELCDYQRKYMTYDPTATAEDRNGMNGVAWVFKNLEMPLVSIVADIEDLGVAFDFDYNAELSEKYNKLLDEKMREVYAEIEPYNDGLAQFRALHSDVKLDDPINIASPKQLEILLFDVIRLDAGIDKKTKQPLRGTGKEILAELDHPICKKILEYRALSKLVETYIDKLPKCADPNDHRIHGKFNQYGADTGRFSSSDPNLQNIPSHNKDIRKMFKATDDEVYVSECNNSFAVGRWCEVNTTDGWKHADAVKEGDSLIVDDNGTECVLIVNKIDMLIDKNQIVYYY